MTTIHRLDIADFHEYEHEHEIAGSYGMGSHKSLIGCVRFDSPAVRFIVKEDRLIVLETNSLELAIEKYNELP